jgi:phage baseplate assembly protein W
MAIRQIRELTISLPFRIDEYGTIAATVDQSKIWADRVRGVIGTAVGERVYRPEFGCAAATSVFETEEETEAILTTEIRNAFLDYLPLCSLEDVVVVVDEQTRVVNAEVTYTPPNSNTFSLQVGVATINGDQPISEEITWRPL